MKFFDNVIKPLMKEADEAFEAHSSFMVADPTAVGENPVRELKLDTVSLDNNETITTLAWSGGNKIIEKKASSEEGKHLFELISSDMAEAVALTSSSKYDEAKKIIGELTTKYAETSDAMVNTNYPAVTTTQADKDEMTLLKRAKITMQNLWFSNPDELLEFQTKMKELQPKTDQDSIPLWDMNKSKTTEGEETPEISMPSMSYDQLEKEKAQSEKNITKRIENEVKEQIESSLEQKKATMFSDKDARLIKVLREFGRSWEEIKDFLTKDKNGPKYDKESVDLYIDDFRSKEEGISPEEKPLPEMPKPPKELVPDEVHDKLLEDLDKPIDEKKSEPPVKEEKEPGLSPKDIMEIPEEKESSKKCPKCGEDIWDVAGGGMTGAKLNKCWNCGTAFDNPEAEVPLSNEIARADNAEIRKVAAEKCEVCEDIRSEADPSREYDPTCVGYLCSKHQSYDPHNKKSSLKKQALNPLQEPPVVEQPTAETSNQDIVPISQTPDHDTPAKGDRVFVMSDLGDEKAGFEGTYVSEYTSKGNQYAIIETDEKDLLDVEMHRVSKVSENTSPEPSIEPNVQKPEEPDIEVTPKMEDLHSSLDDIKTEVKKLEAQLNEIGKISFKFIKKGLEKYANDSAYEANGWTRVWVDESEIEVEPKYAEILKLPDENARISALKELAREVAEDTLSTKTNAGGDIAQMWFESLTPSDRHDRIDWVALANPEQVESSLKQSNVMDTKCEDCGKPLGPEVFLSKHPVCGECTRKKHKKLTQHGSDEDPLSHCLKCDEMFRGHGNICPKCKISQEKKAADPVPAKTEYKELKKAPDYVDPKSAVPASPDMEQVLVKMESLQNKLSVLDQAKEKIKMAMQEELKKIDVGGERSQIEKELQDSYEKLGILIDATESKVINWSDQLYTLQHQQKEVVPEPTTGELLAKIYAKFEGAERYVESVLNGFKALAKKFETKRLVKWPKRSSLGTVEKEASVVDDLNQMNQEMLEALKLLSEPLA